MLVQINAEWQSLNTLTGITAGSNFVVQSQSSSRVYLKQQASQPDAASMDAAILDFKDWMQVSGANQVWARVAATAGQLFIEVL